MKAPAFQFYAGDWLSSQRVALMSLEEEGGYIRLLAFCWQHGSIPDDPEKIARLIGKGASTTLATTLATMFEPGGNGLVNRRLEEVRLEQEAWRAKSSEGGKKSAECAASRRKPRRTQPNRNHPWKGACRMVPTKRQLFSLHLHLLFPQTPKGAFPSPQPQRGKLIIRR